ncbi:MAG TPA: ubiquinol-cytochrome c reductase iron-sulfur subunit [Dehalococcoidia bacterium]|nr:ubiquinol-cytochrome c reductase iron-sulfur subunit [Dehalococcoidia bacterium]
MTDEQERQPDESSESPSEAAPSDETPADEVTEAAQTEGTERAAAREAARTPRAQAARSEAEGAAEEEPAAAAEPQTPVARVEDRIVTRKTRERTGEQREVTRRAVLRTGFFGTMGAIAALGAYQLWNMLWPRGLTGFGGVINVSAERVPQAGADPVRIIEGKFWLVNLQADEGTFGQFGQAGQGGVLALYQKCPHLGCTVPWRPTFVFEGQEGWFRCPCHGSTYTKAGVRVFGPAPRPMDTMAVTVNGDGSVSVDTGAITLGDVDNPQRAVAYNA